MEIMLKNTSLNKENMIYIINIKTMSTPASFPPITVTWPIQPLKFTSLLRIMKKVTHQSNIP